MGGLSNIVVQFPYPGLFCLLILGAIGFPFPEDAILLSCGFLISQRIVMPLPAFLVVYTGIMVGDFLIYSFGKKYGRAVVAHRRFRRLLTPQKLHSLEEKFRKFGVLSVILGRQIMGVRAQTILAAGILGMPVRTFLATDAFASSLTIILMVSLGYTGAKSLVKNHSVNIYGGYLLITIILLATGFCIIKRHREKLRMGINIEDNAVIEKIRC